MSPQFEQTTERSIKEIIETTAKKLNASRAKQQNFTTDRSTSVDDLAKSHVICVASGKGGTGKTTFAANISVLLAKNDLKVTLIDADFGLANSHLLMGVDPSHDISEVIGGNKKLDEIIENGPENVRLVPGGSGNSEFATMGKNRFAHLVQELSILEEDNDVIVVDLPAGINQQVITLLNASHDIIVVSTPEITSLIDAYALIKSLSERCDIINIQMIMNRAINKKQAVEAFQKIWSIASKHLRNRVSLMLLGWLPQNFYVQNAIACRVPVVLKYPQCTTARSLHTISNKLYKKHMFWKEHQIAPWGASSYFKRLRKTSA